MNFDDLKLFTSEGLQGALNFTAGHDCLNGVDSHMLLQLFFERAQDYQILRLCKKL